MLMNGRTTEQKLALLCLPATAGATKSGVLYATKSYHKPQQCQLFKLEHFLCFALQTGVVVVAVVRTPKDYYLIGVQVKLAVLLCSE